MSFPAPWPERHMAYFPLSDLIDIVGAHQYADTGTVTFDLGKFGNCANFGSSNSSKYLSHDADGFLANLGDQAGFSAWIMILAAPATDTAYRIFRWESTNITARYIFLEYCDVSGIKKIALYLSNASPTYLTKTLELNTWYKLDLNINTTCELFVDGVSIGTVLRGTETTDLSRTRLGASYVPGNYMRGKIDEVQYLFNARTPQEIRMRYAFERGMLV